MKQRDIFLESEGNAWLQRNPGNGRADRFPESDSLLLEVLAICTPPAVGTRVLEIGCGDGTRLNWLKENCGFHCYGVDPSERAIEIAKKQGIEAQKGTADQLPFDAEMFDIVIFGFCLYLCDREDLFRIAHEADRVLKNPGWLLIFDFYSPTPSKREYHHCSGIFSYKMDYRRLFTWHPSYTSYSHKVRDHSQDRYTDDQTEWVATSVLRKYLERSE